MKPNKILNKICGSLDHRSPTGFEQRLLLVAMKQVYNQNMKGTRNAQLPQAQYSVRPPTKLDGSNLVVGITGVVPPR